LKGRCSTIELRARLGRKSAEEKGCSFSLTNPSIYLFRPMNRLTRRIFFVVLSIVITLAVGTVGFAVIDHYPVFDAFYMTLTTMTTVGYGEVHPLSLAGRVFNSFLIIFGVGTLLIGVGAMTQTIIEWEFGDTIGKRRSKRMIDKLNDHFIICGYGRV